MYKGNNNDVPDYLVDLFTKTSSSHSYETRQAEFNFVPPKPNKTLVKIIFIYRCCGLEQITV